MRLGGRVKGKKLMGRKMDRNDEGDGEEGQEKQQETERTRRTEKISLGYTKSGIERELERTRDGERTREREPEPTLAGEHGAGLHSDCISPR